MAGGAGQIYPALKTGGVPTKLVGYPSENHGLTAPSCLARRMCGRLARYDGWLKKMDPIWIWVMVVHS